MPEEATPRARRRPHTYPNCHYNSRCNLAAARARAHLHLARRTNRPQTPPPRQQQTMADLRRTRSPREAASAHEAMVAGCVAGSIGQLVGFPLDTLKVRTQLQASPSMALFSGWRVPVATAGAINCANFGVYDSAWRHLAKDVDDDVDAPSHVVFAAGACGGFVISPVSTVISRVKVLQQSCAFPGRGVFDVCRSLVEGGGMRSLWCGFSANFCMECCRGFYMLFFVGAKRYLGGESKDLALWKRSLAGAFAGVASWVVVYPLDVVKTAVQAQTRRRASGRQRGRWRCGCIGTAASGGFIGGWASRCCGRGPSRAFYYRRST